MTASCDLLQSSAVARNPLLIGARQSAHRCALLQSSVLARNPRVLHKQGKARFCDLLQSSALASNPVSLYAQHTRRVCDLLQSSSVARSALYSVRGAQAAALGALKLASVTDASSGALAKDQRLVAQQQGSGAGASNPLQVSQSRAVRVNETLTARSRYTLQGGSTRAKTAGSSEESTAAGAQSWVQGSAARYWQQVDSLGAQSALTLRGNRRAQQSDSLQAHARLSLAAQGEGGQASQSAVSDVLHLTQHQVVTLLDSLRAVDAGEVQRQSQVHLLDDLLAESSPPSSADTALLWTAKTDSLAMSLLELSAPLNSLAAVDGELAASAADGLHHFTAAAAAPLLETGWLYPESPALWRAEYAYLEHSGAPLTLQLTVSDGAERTYSYRTAPRRAEAPLSSRLRLGRGLRAKALRLGLSGEDFVLDGGELTLTPTSRRI